MSDEPNGNALPKVMLACTTTGTLRRETADSNNPL